MAHDEQRWLSPRLQKAAALCNQAPAASESPLWLGIDLGTCDVVSMVVDRDGQPVAVCLDWADVVRDGIVWDFFGAVTLVRRHLATLEQQLGCRFTHAATSFPPGTDPRISINVLESAGLEISHVLDEPTAVADLLQLDNAGVVDIGGGTTEVAVISLGGIVTSSSLRLAGNRMDEAIAMHLRDLLGIKIGERTAEIIKIKIGSILPFEDGRERDMIISGQDVITEQPKEVTIQSEDVRSALVQPCEEMVVHIKETFKKTNPDLASDIIQNGILLTGGGGLLSGLDRYLTDKLEIPVWTSETALTNVVMGCLKVLETPTALKQTLMRSK